MILEIRLPPMRLTREKASASASVDVTGLKMGGMLLLILVDLLLAALPASAQVLTLPALARFNSGKPNNQRALNTGLGSHS
jgi:hypothetical protein